MPTLNVGQSNYPAIQQAIHDIATGAYTFPNSKVGEVPTPEEITYAEVQAQANSTLAWPWFAVRHGTFPGWAEATQIESGRPDAQFRLTQQQEPVWDFDCYMIWRYTPFVQNRKDPATGLPVPAVTNYGVAATTMVLMIQTFTENLTLNGTCEVSTISQPGIMYIEYNDVPTTTVKFTVTAYEKPLVLDWGP